MPRLQWKTSILHHNGTSVADDMTQLDEISPPVNELPRLGRTAPSPALARKLAWTLGVMSAFGPFAIDMYLPGFPRIAKDLGTTIGSVQMSAQPCIPSTR